MIKLTDIAKEILNEDRCKRIADRKYDKPSAYKSGAIVRCRKGKIWKGLKEDVYTINETYDQNTIKLIFQSNPELASIGTLSQYSDYLSTIFPSSKIKDIVYHRKVDRHRTMTSLVQYTSDYPCLHCQPKYLMLVHDR